MNIRNARKKAAVTQEELAKRIGLNRATISKYESGQIEPSISMLRKICEALDCPLTDIMSVDEIMFTASKALDRIQNEIDLYKENDNVIQAKAMRPKAERFLYTENGRIIISAYFLLNEVGQNEAVKRITELADIPKYQRTDAEDSTGSPKEGNMPTQEKLSEGQTAASESDTNHD